MPRTLLKWPLTFVAWILCAPVSAKTSQGQTQWASKIVHASKLSVASAFASCERGNKVFSRAYFDELVRKVSSEQEIPTQGSNGCSYKPAGYSQETQRMVLSENIVDPTPGNGTDCSGYVSGVLCRAGARLKPGSDDCGPSSTEQMIKWGNSANDCFEPLQMNATSQLQPGCLIIWRNKQSKYGHVIVVQKTGEDPFAVRSVKDCKQAPDMKSWDFQEAESLYKYGPSQWDANARFGTKKGPDSVPLGLLHEAACKAAKSEKKRPARVSKGPWTIKVLCHKGPKKPSCMSKVARTFKDESCIFACTNAPAGQNKKPRVSAKKPVIQ